MRRCIVWKGKNPSNSTHQGAVIDSMITRVRYGSRGKNILNSEDAVEIRVIGKLVLWNDELQISGRSPRQVGRGKASKANGIRSYRRLGR